MKRVLAFLFALAIASALAPVGCASSAGAPVLLVDPLEQVELKINQVYKIPDYAELTLNEFMFADHVSWNYGYSSTDGSNSGTEQDYALLYLSILNTTPQDVDYNAEITKVLFVYDGKYEFEGEAYQLNHDYYYPKNPLAKDDLEFFIRQLYTGYYVLLTQLPNAVVNGKNPLVISFEFAGEAYSYTVER